MLRDKIKEIFAKPFSDIDKIICLEALVNDELEKGKAQLRDWQDGFAEQCESKKQDIETKYTNLQDEYERLHYEFQGYRQAVKDILGGEG